MQDYKVRLFIHQIASHTERLALPLSHPDCIISADSRKALHADIVRTIDDLYDCSVVDSLLLGQLSARARFAYINGGL